MKVTVQFEFSDKEKILIAIRGMMREYKINSFEILEDDKKDKDKSKYDIREHQ